ncbi:MAG: hypothetical protein MZV63_51880 [Marinilabiliales bacterium]|nr:hypothetical protein [Marinilabiliales bacterium]
MSHVSHALSKSINVISGQCQRQQPDRGQNRIASPYIVRYNEGLITLAGGKILKCAALAVGDGDNMRSSCPFSPILFLQMVAKNTEGNGRFGCGTALGDDNNIVKLWHQEI